MKMSLVVPVLLVEPPLLAPLILELHASSSPPPPTTAAPAPAARSTPRRGTPPLPLTGGLSGPPSPAAPRAGRAGAGRAQHATPGDPALPAHGRTVRPPVTP